MSLWVHVYMYMHVCVAYAHASVVYMWDSTCSAHMHVCAAHVWTSVCMCTCACTCVVHIWVCVSMCSSACMARDVSFCHSSPFCSFWDRVSCWTWRSLTWLAGQRASESHLSHKPSAGVAGMCCRAWLYPTAMWVLYTGSHTFEAGILPTESPP